MNRESPYVKMGSVSAVEKEEESMLQGIEKIFSDRENMTRGIKKLSYEKNTKEFIERYGEYFLEMRNYTENALDKQAAAREIGECIVRAVKSAYSNRKGKIDARVQSELNLFMVYYVFPTILKQESVGKILADGVLEAWQDGFKNHAMKYIDYDTLYQGFREKVLGLF